MVQEITANDSYSSSVDLSKPDTALQPQGKRKTFTDYLLPNLTAGLSASLIHMAGTTSLLTEGALVLSYFRKKAHLLHESAKGSLYFAKSGYDYALKNNPENFFKEKEIYLNSKQELEQISWVKKILDYLPIPQYENDRCLLGAADLEIIYGYTPFAARSAFYCQRSLFAQNLEKIRDFSVLIAAIALVGYGMSLAHHYLTKKPLADKKPA